MVHQIVDEHGTLKHIILSLDETTNPEGSIQPTPSLSQLGLTASNFPSAAPTGAHDSHNRHQSQHPHPHHHHHQHHQHHHEHQQHLQHNNKNDQSVIDDTSNTDVNLNEDAATKNNADQQHDATNDQGIIEPVKHVTKKPTMDSNNPLLDNDENAIGSNPSYDDCALGTNDDATITMTENVSSAFNSSTKTINPNSNHHDYDKKPNESDIGSKEPHNNIDNKGNVKAHDFVKATINEDNILEKSPTTTVTDSPSDIPLDNCITTDTVTEEDVNKRDPEDDQNNSINDKKTIEDKKHSIGEKSNEPFSSCKTILPKESKNKQSKLDNNLICSNDNINAIKDYVDNDKDNIISDNKKNEAICISPKEAVTSTGEKSTKKEDDKPADNLSASIETAITNSTTNTPIITTAPISNSTTASSTTVTSANTTPNNQISTTDSFSVASEEYHSGPIMNNEILGPPADSLMAAPPFSTVLSVPITSHHSVPPSYGTYAQCCCCCYLAQPGSVAGVAMGPAPLNHSSTSPGSLRVPSTCLGGVAGIAPSTTGATANGIIAFPTGPIAGPGPPPPLLAPNGSQTIQPQTSVNSMHHQHVPVHHHQAQIPAGCTNSSSNVITSTSVTNRSRGKGANIKQQPQRNSSNNNSNTQQPQRNSSNNNSNNNMQQSHNHQHHSHIHNNSQLPHHSTTGHNSEKQQQTNSYSSGYINNNNGNVGSSSSKRSYQHSSNGGINANNHSLNIHNQNAPYHGTGMSCMNNNVSNSSNYNSQHNNMQHNLNQLQHQQPASLTGFSKSHQQVSQRSSNVKNVVSNMNSNNLMIASAHHQMTTSASPTHSKNPSHNHHAHAHTNSYDRLAVNNETSSYHHHNHHHTSNIIQQQLAPTQINIDTTTHGNNHYHHLTEHQLTTGFVSDDSQHNVQAGGGKTSHANPSSSYKLSYKHDLHQNRQSVTNGSQSVNNSNKSFHNAHNSQGVTIFSNHIHQSNNKPPSYHNHDNHQASDYSHGQSSNGNPDQIVAIMSHNNNGKQHHLSAARQSFEPHYGNADPNQNHLSSSPWHHGHGVRPHNQQSNHNNRLMNNLKQSLTNESIVHQDGNVQATHHHPYSTNNSYREIKNKECHTIGLANNNSNQLSSAASNSSFSSSTSSRHNYHSGYNPTTSSGVIQLLDHEQDFQAQNKSVKNSIYHQNNIRNNGITVANAQTNLSSNGRSQQLSIATKNRNQLTSSTLVGPISIKQRPQSAGGKSITTSINNNYQQVAQRQQGPSAVTKPRSVIQSNAVNVTIFNNKSVKNHRVQSLTATDGKSLRPSDDCRELKGSDSSDKSKSSNSKLVNESTSKKADKYYNGADMIQSDDVDDHDGQKLDQKQQSGLRETDIISTRSQSSSSVRIAQPFHQDELSDRNRDDESPTGRTSPVETAKISPKKNSTLNTTSIGQTPNRNSKKQLVKDKATSPGNIKQANVSEKKSCSTSTDDHVITNRTKQLVTVTNYTQTNSPTNDQTNVVPSENDSDQVNLSSESSPSTNSTGDSFSKQNRASKRACARNQQNSSSLKNVPTQHNASTDEEDLQLIVTIDKDPKSGSGISLEMAKIESKISDEDSCLDSTGDYLRSSAKNKTSNKIVRSSTTKNNKGLGDNDFAPDLDNTTSSSVQEQFSDEESADSDDNYCTPNKMPFQQQIIDKDLSTSKYSKDKIMSADNRKVTSFDDHSSIESNNQNFNNNHEAKDQIDKNVKSPKKTMSPKKHSNSTSTDQSTNKIQFKQTNPASKSSTPDRSASVRLNTFVEAEDSSTSLSDTNMSDATSDLMDDQKSSLVDEDQLEATLSTESSDPMARNSNKNNQETQKSSQQHYRKNNPPPSRVATKSLTQLKILNLHCTSITSTSVQLRWSYLQPIAERFGCVSTQSKLFSEHFVVEMGTRKTSDGQAIASSKVIYQGNGTTFKASHLNGQNLYHFRVRRSTTLSIPADINPEPIISLNTMGNINSNNNNLMQIRNSLNKSENNKQQAFKECLVVSEIMSVTLPSHHHNNSKQRGNKSAIANNYCDSQSMGDNQAECYNGQLGSSSSLSLSTGVTSGVGSCGKSSSSQRSSRNKSSFGLISYVRNAFLVSGRAVKGSLTNYSDRKAAVLICILFILSAMLLAIFLQHILLTA